MAPSASALDLKEVAKLKEELAAALAVADEQVQKVALETERADREAERADSEAQRAARAEGQLAELSAAHSALRVRVGEWRARGLAREGSAAGGGQREWCLPADSAHLHVWHDLEVPT